jgi:hypothetical protein
MTVRDAGVRLTIEGLDDALSKAKELVQALERATELSGTLTFRQKFEDSEGECIDGAMVEGCSNEKAS